MHNNKRIIGFFPRSHALKAIVNGKTIKSDTRSVEWLMVIKEQKINEAMENEKCSCCGGSQLPSPKQTNDRLALMRVGIGVGWDEHGVKPSHVGMYDCILTLGYDAEGEPDLSTGVEEQSKVCAICLFLEDEPDNHGEIIIPTSYDGDCDVCGLHPWEGEE